MDGGENEDRLLNGFGVFFWGDKNVLELDRDDGCTTWRMYIFNS